MRVCNVWGSVFLRVLNFIRNVKYFLRWALYARCGLGWLALVVLPMVMCGCESCESNKSYDHSHCSCHAIVLPLATNARKQIFFHPLIKHFGPPLFIGLCAHKHTHTTQCKGAFGWEGIYHNSQMKSVFFGWPLIDFSYHLVHDWISSLLTVGNVGSISFVLCTNDDPRSINSPTMLCVCVSVIAIWDCARRRYSMKDEATEQLQATHKKQRRKLFWKLHNNRVRLFVETK